ncbi:MAG TPA: M48 family metalloprotease [Xanthomonadaceae bacterium]|nr:M48 family metalloprotease [Xanthomonadaceae bacterium]
MRASIRSLVATTVVLALAGCGSTRPDRPDAFETAELDRRERRIVQGRAGPRDAGHERELAALACRIDAVGCVPLRVYVLPRAGLQARLWPNDVLVVGSALLELADRDEHAFALAHELGHRALGHFRTRSRAATDMLELETAADAWARQRLLALGMRADAGVTLLTRLRGRLADADARGTVSRRIAALQAQD